MKRNTALFGASLVVGIGAAAGLVAAGTSSSAASGATYYGVAWGDGTTGQTSGGWTSGAYSDPYGLEFSGSAAAGSGTFKTAVGGTLTVSAKCDGTKLVTTADGKTYQPGTSTSLASLVGGGAVGTVTFGSQMVGGHTVGAYINMAPGLDGTWVALTGASCSGSTTTPTSPTSKPTSPTSKPTSPTTKPTSPTGSPTGSPTTTPTEPPTPTPTTTTLPVTG
ncbi:hypothetical protein [Flexivirga caeni]|nr:hypothetical protein [Flexivirga caeni]